MQRQPARALKTTRHPGQAAAIRSAEDTLLVDESSMIPIPASVALAEARIAKMVVAGDTGQSQAVKNGGASPCSTSPSPRSWSMSTWQLGAPEWVFTSMPVPP